MTSLPNMSMIARCGSWDGGSGMGGFKRQAPFIIGVAGGTASGKTTVYASPLHIITLQPISEQPIHLGFRSRLIQTTNFICRCEMIITLLKDQRVAIISQVPPTLEPSIFSIYPFICYLIVCLLN